MNLLVVIKLLLIHDSEKLLY